MTFHRLEVPGADYYNPTPATDTRLPAGYDWMNNDPTHPTHPSPDNRAAWGDKISGGLVNGGSYFLGWHEPALSTYANRATHAMSSNIDALDDQLRRRRARRASIALPSFTDDSGDAYLQLTGIIWCGSTVGVDLSQLFWFDYKGAAACALHSSGARRFPSVVDVKVGGTSVKGGGWQVNPRLYLNYGYTMWAACMLPTGITLCYPAVDALATESAQGSLEDTRPVAPEALVVALTAMRGVEPTVDWTTEATPYTLQDTRRRTLDDSYRRSATSGSNIDNLHLARHSSSRTSYVGDWFHKSGQGISGHATGSDFSSSNLAERAHLLGATWGAITNYTGVDMGTANGTERVAVDSGFVYLGRFPTGNDTYADQAAGVFGFMHGAIRDYSTGSNHTYIAPADVIAFVGAVATLPGGRWFRASGVTSLTLGRSILALENTSTNTFVYLTVTAITADGVATVRNLDGSIPTYTGNLTYRFTVHPVVWSGDNAQAWQKAHGSPDVAAQGYGGFHYQTPGLEGSAIAGAIGPATFRAGPGQATGPVLEWGSYATNGTLATPVGRLMSDGQLQCVDVTALDTVSAFILSGQRVSVSSTFDRNNQISNLAMTRQNYDLNGSALVATWYWRRYGVLDVVHNGDAIAYATIEIFPATIPADDSADILTVRFVQGPSNPTTLAWSGNFLFPGGAGDNQPYLAENAQTVFQFVKFGNQFVMTSKTVIA